MNPSWLEELDHTADVGLVVRAGSLEELFARAAWAMFSIVTDPATVQPREKSLLSVQATDREALLVRWLSELNYRHITEHRLFSRFDLLALTDQALQAEVWGEKIDLAHHLVYTEIKAITFHGLQIAEAAEGWKAQIIFDL